MTNIHRFFKRAIIILAYLVIIVGIGTGGYFLFRPTSVEPEPTPTNLPEDLKILDVDYLINSSETYDLIAKIHNPNEKIGAKEFTYQIQLFDSSNNIIFDKKFKDYLLPSQTKYLLQFNQNIVDTTAGQPRRASLKIVDLEWKEMPDYEELKLSVRNKSSAPSENNADIYEASGTLINKTSYDLRQVKVNVILFNKDKIVAVNSTILDTVLSSSERFFKTVWNQPPTSSITSLEIEPSTNIYDSDNFLESKATPLESPIKDEEEE